MVCFNALLNYADVKFGVSGDTTDKEFLRCMAHGGPSEEARWLKKLKAEMNKHCFDLCMKNGVSMDNSDVPLFWEHLADVGKVLELEGSPQAAKRKHAKTVAWHTAGRASEAAWIVLVSPQNSHSRGFYWSARFRCLMGEVPQSKVAKVKHVAFVVAPTRHNNFYLDWGDSLCLDLCRAPIPPDEPMWLCPELHAAGAPGTVLGKYFKDVSEGAMGAKSPYAKWALPASELPAEATAAGIRAGAAITLSSLMPAEIVVAATGDLKRRSAHVCCIVYTSVS